MTNGRPEQSTDEGFLRRWVRRKAGRDEEPEHSSRDSSQAPSPPGGASADSEPGQQTEPPKGDADMPPLESIGPGSDISDFFSAGVSDALRNQALRRLFHLPAYNVTDGLDDYAENYNNFEALGDIMTADRRYREEVEAAREAERRSAGDAPPAEAVADNRDAGEPDAGEPPADEAEEREVAANESFEEESYDEGENRRNTRTDPDDRGTEA